MVSIGQISNQRAVVFKGKADKDSDADKVSLGDKITAAGEELDKSANALAGAAAKGVGTVTIVGKAITETKAQAKSAFDKETVDWITAKWGSVKNAGTAIANWFKKEAPAAVSKGKQVLDKAATNVASAAEGGLNWAKVGMVGAVAAGLALVYTIYKKMTESKPKEEEVKPEPKTEVKAEPAKEAEVESAKDAETDPQKENEAK